MRHLSNSIQKGRGRFFAVFSLVALLIFVWSFFKPPFPSLPKWTESNEHITLAILVQKFERENAYWQPILKELHSVYPKIEVKLISTDSNRTDVLRNKYVAEFRDAKKEKRSPSIDIVYMDIIWVAEFAEHGWLQELDISKKKLESFLPDEIETGSYKKKLYRLPFRTDVGLLYYRKDLLEEAKLKPPKTFDDLLSISQTLKNKNLVDWGFAWQGKEYEGLVAAFVEVLEGYSEGLKEEDKGFWLRADESPIGKVFQVGLDKPQAIEAAQFLKSTIETGISPPNVIRFDEDRAIDLFREIDTVKGKKGAAFFRGWPSAWVELNSIDSPVKGKVGIVQVDSESGAFSHGCRGGWGFGIAAGSEHIDEALKVIEFFTDAKIQREIAWRSGYLPTVATLLEDRQIVTPYASSEKLREIIKGSVFRPSIASYQDASKILQHYLSRMLRGANDPEFLTPKDAMEKASKVTLSLLQKS